MQAVHTIAPVWNADSNVLILGTMPSPASRAAGFFYMHPQNRFWKVMAEIFGTPFQFPNNAPERDAAVAERREFLLAHRIALWDVLAECEIRGAEDASIRRPVPNDFSELLSASRIRRVFCTGKTAAALYERHCAARCGLPWECLPSTSPANQGRWPFPALVEAYRAALRPS
ncbi:MAG: DNA-deoxyinosine glycosylase [Treponemataceae bacterium]|nr:DNA-deoxyinosine glycosylase [Treponemataceae bacterium]